MNAVDKRFAALKAFGDKYRPQSNGYLLIDTATSEDMITDIRAMMTLGRTDRWKGTLLGWVAMINENPTVHSHLEWAALQGAIYAGYAAE